MSQSILRIGLVLGLLTVLGPFSTDMYLPAMPSIAADLGTTIGGTQITLTAYMIGFGLGQLFYGPISDQTGRKFPMYLGLFLFILGSLGCYFAPTIEALSAARVLQGLGGAAGMIIPRAAIRDMDAGVGATRLMGTIMMVVSVSPMLAPLAGSGVLILGGWRIIFLALAIFAVFNMVLARTALPETLPEENRVNFNLRRFFAGLRVLFTDRTFMGLTFVGAFGMAGLYLFFANASFVYTGQFGLTHVQYSLAFAVNGLSLFCASRLQAPLAQRFGMTRMIKGAVTVFAVIMIALAVLTATGFSSLPVTIVLFFFGFSMLGLVIPPTMVLALRNHGQIAGLASSLGGTIQMVTAAIVIMAGEPFFDGTALPMVTAIALCSVIAFGLSRITLSAVDEDRLARPSPQMSVKAR